MKLAVMQSYGVMSDIDANLEYLAAKASNAAENGVRLLITPEMFVTGYNLESFNGLVQTCNGEIAQRVAKIAIQTGVHIIYGYCEQGQDKDQLYNSAQLIDKQGNTLMNYRKQHLYGDIDKKWFAAGTDQKVVKLDDINIGILICFDVEFPEAVRLLALQGAQLIAVPTSLMKPYDFVAKNLIQVRAYENQVYVAYANRIGHEAELHYCGSSLIAGPQGEKISGADDEETLLIGEIDLAQICCVKDQVNYLENRLPGHYRQLSEQTIN